MPRTSSIGLNRKLVFCQNNSSSADRMAFPLANKGKAISADSIFHCKSDFAFIPFLGRPSHPQRHKSGQERKATVGRGDKEVDFL